MEEPRPSAGRRSRPTCAAASSAGAHCLDLWVHTYDLAAAVGQPVDLHDDSPALQAACGYVLEHLPRLVALRCGLAEDTAIRVVLRGAVTHDAAVAVRGGRELWELQRGSADHEITGTASALVLLLSGRGDPDHWRQRGALDWSGAGGDAFVHNARLVAPIGAD